MSLKCPNKNLPEWNLLVKKVGETNAYKAFIANNEEVPSLEEIEKIDYNINEVNYTLKSVNILSNFNEKQKQFWNSFKKGNIDSKQLVDKLQIPKEQKELVIQSIDKINNENLTPQQVALELAINYSYIVEINTATQINPVSPDIDINNFQYNGSIYSRDIINNYKDGKEIKTSVYIEAYNNARNLPAPDRNTQHYSKLSAPRGTKGKSKYEGNPDWEYHELEFKTPLITPSIKGHARFATNNGIGWARVWYNKKTGAVEIQELQSDLFQKGRDTINLTNAELQEDAYEKDGKYYFYDRYAGQFGEQETFEITKEKYEEVKLGINSKNQFLQLLNKNNNWVTFFIKSIIQDSAKKGYEKVLFPSGNTASKVEGHQTLKEFKEQKETRISYLESIINRDNKISYDESNNPITTSSIENEINQLKQELERVETEGFAALRPIWNFYENTVTNILNKQFRKENVKKVTDEFGNTWNEVSLESIDDVILLSPKTSDISFEEKYNRLRELLSEKLSADYNVEEYNELVDNIASQLLIKRYNHKLNNPDTKFSTANAIKEIKSFYEGLAEEYESAEIFVKNFDKIAKDTISHLEILGKVKNENEDQDDGLGDLEYSFERISWEEDAIWSNDSKFNSGTKLRSFLFLTKARRIVEENDEIRFDTVTDSTILQGDKLVPLDVVFNTLKQILSDLEPSFDVHKERLEEFRYDFPWIQDVLDKFEGKGDYILFKKAADLDQIKQEFVTIMTNTDYSFKTFLTKTPNNPNDIPEAEVINTNRYSTKNMLVNNWIENFRNSELVKLNGFEALVDEEKLQEIKKWFDSKVSDKNFQPTEEDIIYFTNLFGIELSENLIKKLTNPDIATNERKPKQQWTNTGGIFNLMRKRLDGLDNEQSQSDFEKFNPLYNNSGIRILAEEQADHSDLAQSQSFRNGQGSIVNSVNQQREFAIRLRLLKSNPKQTEALLRVPFLKPNGQKTWLARIASGDVDFLNNFQISFVDTQREKGSTEAKKPTEFSKRQIMSTKLIGYHNQDNKKHSHFVWYVPGKGALSIEAPKETPRLTNENQLTDQAAEVLYSIVQSEINRIQAPLVNQPNYNPQQFYIFPELNELFVPIKQNDNTYVDTKLLNLSNLDFLSQPQAKEAIIKHIKEEFDRINKDKKKQLVENNLIKKDKFINIPVKDTDKFIAEYNYNYLLFHHNMFQTFIGDPALFSKNPEILVTWDNVSKRSTKDMTAGSPVPKGEGGDNFIQLALKTEKKAAINIDEIRDKFSDSAEYAKNFSSIDITDAAEYITYSERLHIYERRGIIDKSLRDQIKSVLDKKQHLKGKLLKTVQEKGLFGPAKPAQTGRRIVRDSENNPILESIDYVKSAEIPLLAQFTKGYPRLDKLRSKMETLEKETGMTVRASYDSANKLGGGVPVGIDEEVTTDNYVVTNREGIRYQTEIPYDPNKSKTVDGTQPRKNIELLMDDATTFIVDGKEVKGSELKKQYRDTYDKIFSDNKLEFDNEYVTNGKIDEKRVEKDLLDEARSRGWSEREIETITFKDGKFGLPLFLHSSDRVQSLISSFVNNKILKIKRHGKSYTAMSEEGFEGYSADMIYSPSYEGYLKPSREEDGEIKPAQILIPSIFKENLEKYIYEDSNGIKRINSELIPNELLQAFGFRIPNSGYNLMSNFEIVGFLPSYMADTIVVPRNLVAQMGMDYDADKLYLYYPEYEVNENILVKSQSNNNRLLDINRSILNNPTIYKYMMEPITSDRIKSFLKRKQSDFTYYYDEYYNDRYAESVDASALIGGFATTTTFLSQIAGKDIYLLSNGEQDIFSFADLEGTILGEIKSIDGRLKIQVNSQFLSMALDNDKEPMAGALNINNQTIGAINTLILSGFDEKTILEFVGHPVVRDFIKEYTILMEDTGDEIITDFELEAQVKALKGSMSKDVGLASTQDLQINTKEARERVLSLFLKAREQGKEIGKLKRAINLDSNMLSKSMFENYTKQAEIENIHSIKIANGAELLGNFMDGILQVPNSIPGFATYYGLIHNNELWSSHFPYDSKLIRESIGKIEDMLGKNLSDKKKIAFLKGFKQYLYSYATDLLLDTGKTKKETLKRLIDTLPTRLYKAKKEYNNTFLNLLQIDRNSSNNNGIPLMYYNNSAQTGLDESHIHNSVLELMLNLDSELAEDIFKYTLLSQPVDSPRSIAKFIPIEYYNVSGISDKLYEAQQIVLRENPDLYSQGLVDQIIKHTPSLSKSFNPSNLEEDKATYDGKTLISFEPTQEDYTKKGIINYKYFYDKEAKRTRLYQYEAESNLYKITNTLGLNEFTEYDIYNNSNINSVVPRNNVAVKSKGGHSNKTNEEAKVNTKVEGTYAPFISKYRGKDSNTLLDTVKSSFPEMSILVDLIQQHIPEGIEYYYETEEKLGSNGVYSRSKNSIGLNIEMSNERKFVSVLMEEMIHASTSKVLNKPYNTLTSSEKAFVDGITGLRRRIREKLEKEFPDAYQEYLDKTNQEKSFKNIVLSQIEGNIFYRVKDNDEFIAGVFLNKSFQEYLNEEPFTKDKSLGQRFFDLVLDLFESFKKVFGVKTGSSLEEALKLSLSIMNETKVDSKEDQKSKFEFTKEQAKEAFKDFIPPSDEDLRAADDMLGDELYSPMTEDKEESSLSAYIAELQKNLEYFKLQENSAKDRSDKNKYKKRVDELEFQIQKLIETDAIVDAINFANQEFKRINKELENDKISENSLLEIFRTVDIYSKFDGLLFDRSILNDPEFTESDLVKEVRKIKDYAKYLQVDKINPIMRNLAYRKAKDELGLNVSFDDVFKIDDNSGRVIFKDTGTVQSWVRSISTTGEPIDQIIQILIDDANSKADDKTFKTFKTIDTQFDKFEKSSFFKEEGFEAFIDLENEIEIDGKKIKNRNKGSLVRRHTSQYYHVLSELEQKHAASSKDDYTKSITDFVAIQDFKLQNGKNIDVRKLYKENDDGTITKLEDNTYIEQLKRDLDVQNIDYALNIQDSRMNDYSEDLQAEMLAIENLDESDAVKSSMLNRWKKANSPFEMMDAFDSKTYIFTEAGKTYKKKGYYRVYHIPNKEFKNKQFEKIDRNEDASDLYNFMIDSLTDYYSKAPNAQAEGLSFNYLAYVPMNLLEEISQRGLFRGMNRVKRDVFNLLTERNSPTLFEEIDAATGKTKYSLKYPISNNSKYLTEEEIEFRERSRSLNLRKILKYTAGKSIDYEFKSEVEAPIKILEAIYQDSAEYKENPDGSFLIKKDGLGNRKAAMTYAITKQLYGIDPENKYNLKTSKKYLAEEKELKEKLEEKLKTFRIGLEQKDLEREKLLAEGKSTAKVDREISTLEYEVRKYESSIGRLGAYFSTDSALNANMKYTQLLGMGYNIGGSFANLFSAGIGNLIEAAGGENFTTKDTLSAFSIMLNSSANIAPGAIAGGILGSLIAPGFGTVIGAGFGTMFSFGNFTETGKKINSLMTRFKVLGNIIDSRSYEKDFLTGEKKWYQKLSPYHLYTMSEYFSQGITMISVLKHRTVEVIEKATGSKKTISLWEAFNEKGEWNTNLYEENDNWKDQGIAFVQTKRNIEAVRDKVHGNYNTPTQMQGNIFGKMTLQYRRWMIETVANRVESDRKDYKLDPEGRTVEGRWRLYLQKDEEGKSIAKVNVNNVLRTLKQVAFFTKNKSYNDLSAYQQANLRRNVRELQSYILLMSLYFALKFMDDDEDEAYLANAMLNSLFRISDDLEFYLNPLSFQTVTGQLMPSLNTIIKAADVLNYGFRVIADDTVLDPLIRNVSDDAKDVLSKKVMRIMPLGNVPMTVDRIVSEAE